MPEPRPDIAPAVLDVLCDAVLAGAAEVVRTRMSGLIEEHYKDATELGTAADERSDAAMRELFEARLRVLDPAIVYHLEESGQSGPPGERRVGGDPLDGTSHFATGGTLYSVQAHVVYGFKNGVWLAADGTYFSGGRTKVNGVQSDNLQSNTRGGLTLAVPVDRYNSIKLFAFGGTSTRTGATANTAGIAWQYRWGGGY